MAGWNLANGLADRGVVVTGAASGIGRATARLFVEAGARVCAIDRDAERVHSLVSSWPKSERHMAVDVDLRNIDRLPEILEDTVDRFGNLYALAHVAAVLKRQPLSEVTEADWDLQHDVNLKSAFFLNRAAGDLMVRQGMGGRIINFTSAAWLVGPLSGSDVYVASKGGVVSMSRGFARQYGPHGILVNTVAPGQIDTPMQHIDNPPEMVHGSIEACPLKRMGRPDEVAQVVVFLASNHASFVSGATINVSGASIMY